MSKKMKRAIAIEATAFGLTAITCIFLYWNFYVKPADDLKYCIISCMQGDSSFESYNSCVEGIKTGKILCEQ